MALIPNFTVSQTAGLPSVININDNSTGSDVAVSSRQIFIQTNIGSYLVPTGTTTNYIVWALANTSIVLDILNKDYAINITVNWLDVNGAILYTKTSLNLFTLYLKSFFYSLTQYQASNLSITQNTSYYESKSKLWGFIKGAEVAISLGNDISGAQLQLDAGSQMINNEKLFF